MLVSVLKYSNFDFLIDYKDVSRYSKKLQMVDSSISTPNGLFGEHCYGFMIIKVGQNGTNRLENETFKFHRAGL